MTEARTPAASAPAGVKVLVPADDQLLGEAPAEFLGGMVDQVEEPLLLGLAHAEENDDECDGGPESYALPDPLAGRVALKAWYRVHDALRRPTPPWGYRLLAPDRHYEYLPLHVATIDLADLDVLDGALQALNRALLPSGELGREGELAEVLAEVADAFSSGLGGRRLTAEGLVGDFGRVLGVLTLTPDDDTRLLLDRLDRADADTIVLTPPEEAAYRRLAGRFTLLIADADPLARFGYDGH
jgi:hypothetical protein